METAIFASVPVFGASFLADFAGVGWTIAFAFCYKKREASVCGSFPLLFCSGQTALALGVGSFLFDTSFLAGEVAQVVQLGATNFTDLVHLDAVDSR